MPSREEFIAAARTYVGVPWRHQGRNRTGVDCIGLLVCAARDIGLDPDDTTIYARRSNGQELLAAFRKNCDQINPLEARPGDIVVISDRIYPHHVALLVGDIPLNGAVGPGILHASMRVVSERGFVVEQLLTDDLRARINYAFQIRGLT